MAYAVAMKTIEHFEVALGRVALWAPRRIDSGSTASRERGTEYVQRLRIYPHALRAANAYLQPGSQGTTTGLFHPAANVPAQRLLPGASYSPRSRTTSSRTKRRTRCSTACIAVSAKPTNPDVLAFHEAFADIVALFQHFTLPEALSTRSQRRAAT